MKRIITIAAVLLAVQGAALGTGFMVPGQEGLSGLELVSHRVSVDINEQTARTKVVEVFRNQHSTQLEATFIFPLPKNAQVSDFKMYVNGKLVTGEIMEAAKARGVYEEIVRRMVDPGLLEYMDSQLLRMRVFPIPPGSKQEVQVTYDEQLTADGALVEYTYPLRTDKGSAKTLEDFTLSVEIASSAGVKNVYSPTHEIAVTHRDDKHAAAGFEMTGAQLDRNFQLFYEITKKDFGASVISQKKSGEDGYFILLLSPKVELSEEDISPKDVVFVLDTSGSMKGEKMEQARQALSFCVKSLNKRDRFNIVGFSVAVDAFAKELVDATEENRTEAGEFIKKLNASGGTNINEALETALSMKRDTKRPYVVVFMTDGLPTVGVTKVEAILENVAKVNDEGTRVFSFGVGYDVNTDLLDKLSEASRGITQYVAPEESIEVKVSAFFSKIGDPVLSDVTLDYGKAGAYDVYPPHGVDLFAGGQVVLAGRYRDAGDYTLTVRGKGARGEEVFEYPVKFDEAGGKAAFVGSVWAGRKISYLLGEVRLHGEKEELKTEIIALSKTYGIVTPYTSYLITEDSPVLREMPVALRQEMMPGSPRAGGARNFDLLYSAGEREAGAIDRRAEATPTEAARLKSLGYIGGAGDKDGEGKAAGKAAVDASTYYWDGATTGVAEKGNLMRAASGRTFVKIEGVWIDDSVTEALKTLKVKFGSKEYFEIYTAAETLQDALKLGERIVIAVGKWRLVVGEEGFESDQAGDYAQFVKEITGK